MIQCNGMEKTSALGFRHAHTASIGGSLADPFGVVKNSS